MPVFNQSRSYIIRLIFLVAFLIMVGQLFNLQIVSSKYKLDALNNAVFKKVVYPPRGIVYDRKKKAIVNNVQMFDLMVTPSEVKNLDTSYLCQLLEIDTATFKSRMLEAIVRNGRYRPSSFEGLLTSEKYARLQENMWRFEDKGFFLQDRPVRTFPFNVGAHFMGYIGEVDSGIIARSEGFYQPGDYVGRSGLESYYEKVLMGQRGIQYLIKDHRNRLVGSYERGELDEKPVSGRGLETYIDVELQQLAEKLLRNKVGAVVAIEPQTGGILAMASGPSFNPNELTGASFKKTYSKLVLDVSGPLLNRAIKGQYPPGSTFKPIGGLVALDQGVITPSFGYPCSGRYYGCGHGKPACTHKNPGHAANLRLAIANSCNPYFAHVYRLTVDNPRAGGVKKGYAKWEEYMNDFGLGKPLGIDLPSEDRGNIPDTAAYNKEYRNAWNSCTNLTLGIGQDKMLATPLQLANAMCIIANKGYYYTPHFVRKIEDETPEDTIMRPFRTKHEVLTHISDTAFNAVIKGMNDVVVSGTARSAALPGINVCAKTGTAENFRILDGRKIKLKDNAVFVSFAPMENPKIVIAVVVENGGFGGVAAGPISSLIMEKYLNDTLRTERLQEVEKISNTNFMPSYLPRLQYIEDSSRAFRWFTITKDSNYIRKYLRRTTAPAPKEPQAPKTKIVYRKHDLIEPEKIILFKKKNATT
jgi:penicillin-binding protein 2